MPRKTCPHNLLRQIGSWANVLLSQESGVFQSAFEQRAVQEAVLLKAHQDAVRAGKPDPKYLIELLEMVAETTRFLTFCHGLFPSKR